MEPPMVAVSRVGRFWYRRRRQAVVAKSRSMRGASGARLLTDSALGVARMVVVAIQVSLCWR